MRLALAWDRISNPIYGLSNRACKDPALVYDDQHDEWVLLFSAIGPVGPWEVRMARSPDGAAWEAAAPVPHDPSVEGEGSPDVVRHPSGGYVVTFQSFRHDALGDEPKLHYRLTQDFVSFSRARPLAHSLYRGRGHRIIDGALAWTSAGLILGFKYGGTDERQRFEIACSASGSLDGPWELVGVPDIELFDDTIENYQFVFVDGRWLMVATSNSLNRPYRFWLAGDPSQASGWLSWTEGVPLDVPKERWNSGSGWTGADYEHANSAFLLDERDVDGHFYLVYSDAPEMSSFDGQGHACLALARSTDLDHWDVPPSSLPPLDTR